MLHHLLLLHACAHQFGGAGSGAKPFATNTTTSTALPGARYTYDLSPTTATKAPTPAPLKCTAKNASVLTGVKFMFNVELDLPSDLAHSICCSVASGFYFTNTNLGPSKNPKHSGQNTYVCTAWGPSDPNVPPQFAPGNNSVSAGHSPRPPPPDPKCTSKKTIHDCLSGAAAGMVSCSWSGSKGCTYSPPLECGGFNPPPAKRGPFCIGIMLDQSPFMPGGSPPRVLNSFNWTAGTTSGSVKPVQMPPQIIKLGQNGWLSTEVDPDGWQICVYYDELLKNGTASNPTTRFMACASLGGGLLDLTRAATPNMGDFAVFGASTGWSESGYNPHASTAMWGQFIFWSNSTAVAVA